MSNRRESIERIIDNNYLKVNKNTPFENISYKLLEAYKKIFFVVYDAFESRYQKLYASKYLSGFFDGIFFLSLYEGFIKIISKDLENEKENFDYLCYQKATKEKKINKEYLIEYLNKIEFLFHYYNGNENENSNEYFRQLNFFNDKKSNRIEYYLNCKNIFDEIRFKVFDQAESWLTVSEYDKIILQPTIKDQDKKMISLSNYILNNKDRFSIKYINQLSNITDDFKPLYSLLNADRKTDFYKSFKQPFKDTLINQSGEFQSAHSDQPERKSLEIFFKRFNKYLKGKMEFEERMINQLKQLTNL